MVASLKRPQGSSSSRRVPVNSRGSDAADHDAAADGLQRKVEEGRRPEGEPRRRPARTGPAGQRGPTDSSGARRHDGGEQARLDDDAAALVDERDARRRFGGAPGRVRWSRWSGCTQSTRISFRAPMWARLNRSTNSVAVRRGSTRNAEYP